MTWDLIKVEILARPADPLRPGLSNLQRAVSMTFVEYDGNGAMVGSPHVYTEPFVTDVSDAGIAKLARDQMAQLNKVSAVPIVVVADISPIKALMTPQAPEPPTQDEIDARTQAQAIAGDIDLHIRHRKALELGLILADDPELAAVAQKLDTAIKTDRALVLSLLP